MIKVIIGDNGTGKTSFVNKEIERMGSYVFVVDNFGQYNYKRTKKQKVFHWSKLNDVITHVKAAITLGEKFSVVLETAQFFQNQDMDVLGDEEDALHELLELVVQGDLIIVAHTVDQLEGIKHIEEYVFFKQSEENARKSVTALFGPDGHREFLNRIVALEKGETQIFKKKWVSEEA